MINLRTLPKYTVSYYDCIQIKKKSYTDAGPIKKNMLDHENLADCLDF